MQDIGRNIKALRTQKNMTQDELAEKLFVTRQTVSNYETGRSRPDVEMLAKIAEVLETDANTVIYGQPAAPEKSAARPIFAGCAVTLLLILIRGIITPYVRSFTLYTFTIGPRALVYGLLDPLIWLCAGWTLMQMLLMALKKGSLSQRWAPILRRVLALILALWFFFSAPYVILFALDDYLYAAKLRGELVEESYESDGEILMGTAWHRIPLPGLEASKPLGIPLMQFNIRHPWTMGILGALMVLCGFPMKKGLLKK